MTDLNRHKTLCYKAILYTIYKAFKKEPYFFPLLKAVIISGNSQNKYCKLRHRSTLSGFLIRLHTQLQKTLNLHSKWG